MIKMQYMYIHIYAYIYTLYNKNERKAYIFDRGGTTDSL